MAVAMPPQNRLLDAVDWLVALATGQLATAIAVIVLIFLGLSMMTGRIPLRRGVQTILGCFVLFGAQGIATGIMSSVRGEQETIPAIVYQAPAPRFQAPPPGFGTTANPFDPYAGRSSATQGQ